MRECASEYDSQCRCSDRDNGVHLYGLRRFSIKDVDAVVRSPELNPGEDEVDRGEEQYSAEVESVGKQTTHVTEVTDLHFQVGGVGG